MAMKNRSCTIMFEEKDHGHKTGEPTQTISKADGYQYGGDYKKIVYFELLTLNTIIDF